MDIQEKSISLLTMRTKRFEDEKNKTLYQKYKERSDRDGLITVGRLAEYKYYDMDDTIKSALKVVRELCEKQ